MYDPWSTDKESGNTTTWYAGSTMYSAALPAARSHWTLKIHTRRPIHPLPMSLPTASMRPAPSLWGITRGYGIVGPDTPARALTSDGLTPENATRTRTSPGAGEGVGNSPTCRTSLAGPFAV